MSPEVKTYIVYDERHKNHMVRTVDPCESSERVEAVKDALLNSGLEIALKTPDITYHPLVYMTHSPLMIDDLKKYSDIAEPGDQIYTRFCRDDSHSTPIQKGTFDQAMIAACSSIEAAELIKSCKAKLAFSLSRPPGHHAGYDFYHGFCYLNNAALAARNLLQVAKRVALIDFDIHHGDGTQNIFYKSGEVLFVSLHADPTIIFPMTGFANETGEGKGKGLVMNLPLDVGISASNYKMKFDIAIKTIEDYNPDVLVVDAGFDGHMADFPPGGEPLTQLTDMDYEYLGQKIGSLDVPSCVILEGGYNLNHLPDSVLHFFSSLNKRLIKGRKNI